MPSQQEAMSRPLLIIAAEQTQRALMGSLQEDGWQVTTVETAEQALVLARQQPLALVLLDLHLLSQQSISEVQALCAFAHDHYLPLLCLLAPDMEIAQVEHAGMRADDYLPSPFHREEVRACVRTLLRRSSPKPKRTAPRPLPRVQRNPFSEVGRVLVAGNLRIDLAGRQVFQHGRELQIGSPVLFDLLVYLVRHRDQVLSPQQLLEQVWGYTQGPLPEAGVRTVYVHICWLRSLIETEEPSEQHCSIKTVRGKGYQWHCQDQEAVPQGFLSTGKG